MARRSPLRAAADEMLGGKLSKFLREHRARGLSPDAIAKELWRKTDYVIAPSGETVRRWLAADDKEAAA